ncbi:uncharacterized protein BDW43DRAFT_304329 [Aspergillus alliaceus]|uniref:uncharacterized protein n=1 Tax=Petromyces alliaceus TaxID=209559 RepID=UPI0012A5F79A|nr:uncharacterized protein BDW43DRAFT_304329 [Aspergillus alliaceus]KAB8227864.1 hypothetical protein BDW43DRAFT_304329 [Aspergillus alliaceus]
MNVPLLFGSHVAKGLGGQCVAIEPSHNLYYPHPNRLPAGAALQSSAWVQAVRQGKVENKTIHDIDLNSASAIRDEQYLMLRVLWKTQGFRKLDRAKFGLGEWINKAADLLAPFSSEAKEGSFALSRFYQNLPRTRGQLKSIAAGSEKLSFDVPTEPLSTRIVKPEAESDDSSEEDSATEDTPPGERSHGSQELQDLNYPRTKDEHIVNTVLNFSARNYIKYSNSTLNKDESPGLLTLYEFGPWDTTKVGDMKDLCPILLAIALRAEMEGEEKGI